MLRCELSLATSPMKKIFFISVAGIFFTLLLSHPVQAQTQTPNIETQKLIAVLLQKIVVLQQELLMLQKKEAASPTSSDGAITTNQKNPTAILNTNFGVIEVELFADVMPITVSNFIKLARKDYYNETKFHRVIEGFMIQGGDPITKTNDVGRYGTGGPGYVIGDEHISGRFLTNIRGTISMANSGPNSGGSQFFINLVDNTGLDFDKDPLSSKHPVFGHVINGMNVVDAIGRAETTSRDLPVQNIVIKSVIIKSKG